MQKSGPGARACDGWPGAELVIKEQTVSTMDDCLALGRRGSPSGTTVVAGCQERGRGRTPDRRWLSAPWESLLATVLVRGEDLAGPGSELPLRAALAVCRAVEDALGDRQDAGSTGRCRIKWPNDIMLKGRKLAGVLCERHGDLLLVGIGVNCLQRSFPPGIADSACSLASAGGREVSPLELCPLLLARLRKAIADPSWRSRVEERLAGRGERVRVAPLASGSVIEGIVLGIDGDGSLLLRDASGRITRAAHGEISGSP